MRSNFVLGLLALLAGTVSINAADDPYAYCDLCVGELGQVLQVDKLSWILNTTVGLGCGSLPLKLKSMCTNFMENQGMALIRKAVSMGPEKICQKMKACAPGVAEDEEAYTMEEKFLNEVALMADQPTVGDSYPYCGLCEYAMGEVLQVDKLSWLMNMSISLACGGLGAKLSPMCTSWLEELGMNAIRRSVKAGPEKACQEMKACPLNSFMDNMLVARDVDDSSEKCDTCTQAVTTVKGYLIHLGGEDLQNLFNLACKALVMENLVELCQKETGLIFQQYRTMIDTLFDPSFICKSVCSQTSPLPSQVVEEKDETPCDTCHEAVVSLRNYLNGLVTDDLQAFLDKGCDLLQIPTLVKTCRVAVDGTVNQYHKLINTILDGDDLCKPLCQPSQKYPDLSVIGLSVIGKRMEKRSVIGEK